MIKRLLQFFVFSVTFLLLTGCESNQVILSNIDEREANQIIVFLASKGIPAQKITAISTAPGGGQSTNLLFDIAVAPTNSTEAMALLNQNGFPRRKGVSLLDLFAKQGLMSSEREETIRYQAGLAEQIANTIRKIDGILDADVELSFPPPETGVPGLGPQKKVTASVYVKHQGILEDPNSHLTTKIKLLVAGSVNGLDVNDVTVISDRSRFSDISLQEAQEMIAAHPKEYVSVWSIIMNQASVGRFRMLLFTLCSLVIVLGIVVAWMIWKFYPLIRSSGFKALLEPAPIHIENKNKTAPPTPRKE